MYLVTDVSSIRVLQ